MSGRSILLPARKRMHINTRLNSLSSTDGSRGSAATHILIKCPRNRRPVSTGLTTDMVIFDSLPPVTVPLRCPACGQIHWWKPEDAWVAQVPRLAHTA